MLPNTSPLLPEDLAALASLQRANTWLRSVLCTLARRGVVLRKKDAERARQILDTLAPLPLYKGGQFLFDLMEWDDFMVDGDPPPVLTSVLDAAAQQKLMELLENIRQQLDGSIFPNGANPSKTPSTPLSTNNQANEDEELPPLEPGFYLYQDFVLGIVQSIQTK